LQQTGRLLPSSLPDHSILKTDRGRTAMLSLKLSGQALPFPNAGRLSAAGLLPNIPGPHSPSCALKSASFYKLLLSAVLCQVPFEKKFALFLKKIPEV